MWRRRAFVFGLLALGACALEASGDGVALPGVDPVHRGGGDGGGDALVGLDAVACDACVGETITVDDLLDDDTLVDGASTSNVVVAGGGAALVSALDVGTGADGACSVTSTIDLAVASCANRPFPDAPVSYLVSDALASETELAIATALPGLAAGDELLIVDTQSSSALAVGRFETKRVASVSGTTITLAQPLAAPHLAIDRVTVLRLPNYSSVIVKSGAKLVTPSWNGVVGGLVAMRARDSVDVGGAIDVSGRGFRGAQRPPANSSEDGWAGESFAGGYQSSRSNAPNGSGGGAGRGDGCGGRGVGGGGGGHGGVGGRAGDATCGGFGGAPFGATGRLTLGPGGGSGGNDNSLGTNPVGGAGGSGGGAVLIEANAITVTGSIAANGAPGQGDAVPCTSTSSSSTMCFDFSGPGGGGAGGTINLRSHDITIGSNTVVARGGPAGIGYNNLAGDGAPGRVALSADRTTGTSIPGSDSEAIYPTAGRFTSKDLLASRAPAVVFVSITIEVRARPDNTKVRVLVSADGASWSPAMPPGVDSLPVGVTTVPLDTVLGGSASFFYRVQLDGAGFQTPVVERVMLTYLH